MCSDSIWKEGSDEDFVFKYKDFCKLSENIDLNPLGVQSMNESLQEGRV